jgi:crotonobetainyl-CoA:carnitine CoA-transferase CaiB-like acyl-CoA transferase
MTAAPLSGFTVVDLTRLLPGPLAARLLADLGARVIKVEEPRLGDPVRWMPPAVEGVSALASILLAGVESVALDLKRPAGRQALHGLLAGADVLLDTFRPGGLARLGLDLRELQERYPRLVACSLTGWGETGPLAARAGHDLTYQALAGALAPTRGLQALPAAPVADVVGAWSAAASVLAALLERERTGRGRRIDASLYDAAVHANLTAWAEEAGRSRRVGEPLPLTGALPCYRLYATRDRRAVALAALEPHFWQRFCRAVERPDLERLQYRSDPEAHRAVAELIAQRTRAEWQELFRREDLPAEPVLGAAEAARHPQLRERGVLREQDGRPALAFPALFDGQRPAAAGPYPKLGEHTTAVLREVAVADTATGTGGGRAAGIGRRLSWKRWIARLRLRGGS